jgi:hypothetical protein
MWPLWAYLLGGVVSMILFLGGVGLLVYLKDEYEEVFMMVVVTAFFILAGCGLGWLKYNEDLKALHNKPRPPAEAPAQ